MYHESQTHRKPHTAEDELRLGSPVATVVLVVVVRRGHGGGPVVAAVCHGSDAVAAVRHRGTPLVAVGLVAVLRVSVRLKRNLKLCLWSPELFRHNARSLKKLESFVARVRVLTRYRLNVCLRFLARCFTSARDFEMQHISAEINDSLTRGCVISKAEVKPEGNDP